MLKLRTHKKNNRERVSRRIEGGFPFTRLSDTLSFKILRISLDEICPQRVSGSGGFLFLTL